MDDDGGMPNSDYARPSSKHPGGFVTTFCGGNVRFLSEDIEYRVYALLMTSNGSGAKVPGTSTPITRGRCLTRPIFRCRCFQRSRRCLNSK